MIGAGASTVWLDDDHSDIAHIHVAQYDALSAWIVQVDVGLIV